MLRLNKPCEVEDFVNPDLDRVIRAVFKREANTNQRKHWETGMAVLAMERWLPPERRQFALGVGAGSGATSFYLTNFFRWVFATDLYLDSEQTPDSSVTMLRKPWHFADGVPFHAGRLVTQHMDARQLRYESDTFDFIYSRSAIAQLGNLAGIRQALREMARVLKPEGIIAISSEFCIQGLPEGADQAARLLSRNGLLESIVDASGCEPVDEPSFDVSKATLDGGLPVVLRTGNRSWTSYHLTLRKRHGARSTFAPSPVYAAWHAMQDRVIQQAPAYPEARFSGRGIVICAGGARLFTCAWVLIRMLREVVRAQLPIQVWYLGAAEMDPRMIALLEGLGVQAINAYQCESRAPAELASGWALKPFAILNSSFREVIFIDADNVPLVDPAVLFATRQYAETGAIFWPDINPIPADAAIWDICRVPYRDEAAFESGQVVIDKARCWKALLLAMHMNERSDFYYQHLNGDKDTFHMAFRMLDQPYSIVPEAPELILPGQSSFFEFRGPALGQRDFDGGVIFQHRNHPKWVLLGENPRYPKFRFEDECLGFLKELGEKWDGRVTTLKVSPPPDWDRHENGARWFRYTRLSSDERILEFLPDHRIGYGADHAERRWRLVRKGGKRILEIQGDNTITCLLERGEDGIWRGYWLRHERMPVEIAPLNPANSRGDAWWKKQLGRFRSASATELP